VREYLDVEVIDQPVRVNNRYFYRRRARGREQSCIYVRDANTGVERLLVDPSAGGPFVSVNIHRISVDGSLLAYERRQGGEDQKSIHVLEVQTGTTLNDEIARGYGYGFTFATDNRGFYYSHETETDSEEHTIRRHVFHDAATDPPIFRVKRSLGSRLVLAADSVHLGAIWFRDVGGVMYGDLWMAKQCDIETWHQVFANRKLPFSPFLKNGRLFAVSYENAENGRLLELNQHGEEVSTILDEQKSVFRQLVIAQDKFIVLYQDGLKFALRCWDRTCDEFSEINLPPNGTVGLLPDLGDGSSIFLSYESFTQPPTILEYTPADLVLSAWHERSSRASTPLTIRRTSYSSLDGTEIPITFVGHQAFSNVETPVRVIMTSYGGFGVAMTPQFSVLVTLLLESGALLAIPHVRGGGELGKAWHNAGRRRSKRASFDDFVAAAGWLVCEGITSPSQLAIFGGSNSGLLVGAAMIQRPDLFRAVLCIAPLLDMVRYEYFDQALSWRKEYGSCESELEFQTLHAYSPYHRIAETTEYPSVLFVTGDKDDRCNPSHVRKMAARLLENTAQTKPVLVDYSFERGHSPALPLSIRIDALARRVAFLCHELNTPILNGGCNETACA
jgi:prolyl oligopeptidase